MDSQAAIAAENLLGTKYINIKKGHSQDDHHGRRRRSRARTRGIRRCGAAGRHTLAALKDIFKKLDTIIDQIQEGKGTIGKLLSTTTLYKKVVGIVDEAQSSSPTLDSQTRHARQADARSTACTTTCAARCHRVNDLIDNIKKARHASAS